jgi:hypothetical protein
MIGSRSASGRNRKWDIELYCIHRPHIHENHGRAAIVFVSRTRKR